MKKTAFLLLIGTLLLSACNPNLTPFTQRLYDENDWSATELKRIQFYLSEDIVLRRDSERSQSRINKGEIEVVRNGDVEKIVIRKGTPGVFVFSPKEDRFAISFENSDERFLMFGPNPKSNNRYLVLASDWKKRGGVVTYGDKRYRIDSSNAYAALMVDLKKMRKVEVKARTAGGRRVD